MSEFMSEYLANFRVCGFGAEVQRQRRKSSKNGATTLYGMTFSQYVGHVTIFGRMFTIACCLVPGLGLRLGLDLVSG